MRVTQSRMGGGKVRKPSIKSDAARKKLLNPYDLPFNPFDDVPIQKLRQEESRQKQMKKSKTTFHLITGLKMTKTLFNLNK